MAERMTALILSLVFMLSCTTILAEDIDAEDTDDRLLIDYGNGITSWYAIPEGQTTFESAIVSALKDTGVDCVFADLGDDRTIISINGQAAADIGSGKTVQTCKWIIYSWNGVSWDSELDDAGRVYHGGAIAVAYYPSETIAPASNPEYETVWNQYRGTSSSDGTSHSYGPEKVAKPLEWYKTYSGSVDASILYADGLIYHTVAGLYGSVGMEGLAWLYCLDPVNKEVAWSVSYSDSGNIEIVTPVIIGDMIVLFSGNWHVYCLDRFTGEALAELVPEGEEADMCNRSKVTEYVTYRQDACVVMDRTHVSAGPTNAVYDSGALYFGTSDGVMHCFSIDRHDGFCSLWTSIPKDDVRGCFYFYPPCITDINGKKVVLIGNTVGNLLCFDASNGTIHWTKAVLDSSGNKAGAVTSINVCSDERVLVCFSDGGMSSSSGGILLIKLSDKSVVWEKDYLCSKPAVYGVRFYIYVSYSHNGCKTVIDHDTGEERELVSGYYSFWVDDCSACWVQDSEALSIGGITYCDGRIYSMDYSPGSEGSLGGWVWCIDTDTGFVVWKAKVAPTGGAAYSMCAPTVVDGKVLVGNDYGAVYVISETPGVEKGSSDNISYKSQGLAHWSWVALIVTTILAIVTAVAKYRGA